MISLAFYDLLAGSGKTTLAYHLAHMFQRSGLTILTVDLDPQADLTRVFLTEDDSSDLWPQPALFELAEPSAPPLTSADSSIELPGPRRINDGIWLLPGHVGLFRFESPLAASWQPALAGDPAAIENITTFRRLIAQAAESVSADLVLIDIGPNLDAISRSALLAADAFITPLNGNLRSQLSISTLGPAVRKWWDAWSKLRLEHPESAAAQSIGQAVPLGYTITKLDRRRTKDFWIDNLIEIYQHAFLDPDDDPSDYDLGRLRYYGSLMELAERAHKPMFDLRPSDGAIGSTQKYVQICRDEFRALADNILDRLDRVRKP
ncbi:hypothetical protein Afil01_42560 [Actinorhabdospora filicis]|uniref:AAA domain-containing protein n=1 Tax=Actinorhabdospora filicis TaxID=1785913 RepID=A0A9W6SP50_9ACTN|nr:ParA family protein [Actinorhabdospora filicis]GLZ79449.1 hypothetical protein Afil01_42560 [Actinorhabdospora filicis]